MQAERNHSSPISPRLTGSPASLRRAASTPGRGRPMVLSASSSSASRSVPSRSRRFQSTSSGSNRARRIFFGQRAQCRWRGGTADNDGLHRGEIEFVDRWVCQHERYLRCDAGDCRHAVFGDEAQHGSGRPAFQQMGGSAAGQQPRQFGHETDVCELGGADAVPATAPGTPVSSSTICSSWRLAYQAPFGRPVEPLVKHTHTARSRSSVRGATG